MKEVVTINSKLFGKACVDCKVARKHGLGEIKAALNPIFREKPKPPLEAKAVVGCNYLPKMLKTDKKMIRAFTKVYFDSDEKEYCSSGCKIDCPEFREDHNI